MKPIKSADWITALYDQMLARLSSHSTDAEVRACAEDSMGDILRSKDKKEWEYIIIYAG